MSVARGGGATAEKPKGKAGEEEKTDFPYKFEILDLDKLFVDDSYQRPLTSFVERIKNGFDPALVGTLVTSAREDEDGTMYALVDGQTRWAAMSELGPEGGAPTKAPCLVYYGLSQQDEARLFARLQKERRGIASFHRFRASLVAGEEEAIEIDRIAREAGYEVGLGGANSNAISAVAGLEKVYRRGPDLLERVLLILKEAWKDRHVPNGEILRGMGWFLVNADNEVDDERLAMRLMLVTPEELKRRASALREGSGHGGGSDRFMGGAIEGVYMSRAKRS